MRFFVDLRLTPWIPGSAPLVQHRVGYQSLTRITTDRKSFVFNDKLIIILQVMSIIFILYVKEYYIISIPSKCA
jgi:hypothetical protein